MRRSLPWILLVVLAGCAGSSRVGQVPLDASYATARDGRLRYRCPAGWFDATPDPQASGHALLLIRNDYHATIAVDEVQLDSVARQELRSRGLAPLAPLLASLNGWENGRSLVEPPREVDGGGGTWWRYTLERNGSEERLEVTLVDAGGRLYAVSVLRSDGEAGGNNLFDVLQDGFIGALRW
jgi:hypothetical protein